MHFRRETVCIADAFIISGMEAAPASDFLSGTAFLSDSPALSHAQVGHEFKEAASKAASVAAERVPKVLYHDENFVVTDSFVIYKNELHELPRLLLVDFKARPFQTVRLDLEGGKFIEHRSMVGDAAREIREAVEKALALNRESAEEIVAASPPMPAAPPDSPPPAEAGLAERIGEVESGGGPEEDEYDFEDEEYGEDEDYEEEEYEDEIAGDAGDTGHFYDDASAPPRADVPVVFDVRPPGQSSETPSEEQSQQKERRYYQGKAGYVTDRRVFVGGKNYRLDDIVTANWQTAAQVKGCSSFNPGCVWISAIMLPAFMKGFGLLLGIVLIIMYYVIRNAEKKKSNTLTIVFVDSSTATVSDAPGYDGELAELFLALDRALADAGR